MKKKINENKILSNGSFVLLGVIDEIILEGKSVHKPSGEFKQDKTFINGLSDYQLHIREHIKVRARHCNCTNKSLRPIVFGIFCQIFLCL